MRACLLFLLKSPSSEHAALMELHFQCCTLADSHLKAGLLASEHEIHSPAPSLMARVACQPKYSSYLFKRFQRLTG